MSGNTGTILKFVNVLEESGPCSPFVNTEHISCLSIFPTLLRIKVSCFTNSIKSGLQLQMTRLILPFIWLSWKVGEKSSRLLQEHNHGLCNAWKGILFPVAQGKDPKGKPVTKANFLLINKAGARVCKKGFKLPVLHLAGWCPDFSALTTAKEGNNNITSVN